MIEPIAAGVRPDRILMTADAVGGVWGYAIELSRALASAGVDVHLATMGRTPTDAQRTDAAAVPGLTLHASTFRLEWMDEPWEDVDRAGDWLLAVERRVCPDVVHLNGYAHGALPFGAPTLIVAHSCVLSWWRAVHGTDAPAEWEQYRARVRAGLRGANLVAAPTSVMLASIREHYAHAGPGRVVANARDATRFRRLPKEPYVLSAGRVWDAGKNIGAVVRAAGQVRWPVFIAGDDTPPEGAGGVVGTARGAHFLGRLSESELARWLGHAAIFALPARYEPFGLAALEAGLAGCALVLGDIPTLREVWGDAPIWVDPEDDRGLACAIRALAADSGFRELVAARCRSAALYYTLERMRDAYAATYGELLAGRVTTDGGTACAS